MGILGFHDGTLSFSSSEAAPERDCPVVAATLTPSPRDVSQSSQFFLRARRPRSALDDRTCPSFRGLREVGQIARLAGAPERRRQSVVPLRGRPHVPGALRVVLRPLESLQRALRVVLRPLESLQRALHVVLRALESLQRALRVV
jgi:hypothetical protein